MEKSLRITSRKEEDWRKSKPMWRRSNLILPIKTLKTGSRKLSVFLFHLVSSVY
jgi:hypothetical protein